MEKSSVHILDNFGLVSILIPYYDSAHRSFILLSTLCKKSRDKLRQYYPAFRRMTLNSVKTIGLDTRNFLKIPNDLFKLDLNLDSEENCSTFVSFIKKIHERNGCYFEEHYMHEKLYVNSFYVNFNFICNLHWYIDLMKSIPIFQNPKAEICNEIENQPLFLLNIMVMCHSPIKVGKKINNSTSFTSVALNELYNLHKQYGEVICNNFNKIYHLSLANIQAMDQHFLMMKKGSFWIKNLYLSGSTETDIDFLIDSDYYK